MSGHTPGPWKRRDNADYAEVVADSGVVAMVARDRDVGVIAAAPDMLAALIAVEKWWLEEGMKKHEGAPYAMFATRTVIAMAKAEGKQ